MVTGDDGRSRCAWGASDPLYVPYHDDEWGRPLRDERALVPPAHLVTAAADAESLGRTPVWIAVDDEIRAVVVVADTVKDSAAEAIRDMRRLGLTPILLTGDNERAALAVAAEVGIA